MNIPEQAIDGAAAAIIVTEGRAENIRALASRIVNAAAPFIAAEAWDEGYRSGLHAMEFYSMQANPYRKQGEQ
jgi:hypothetical protein